MKSFIVFFSCGQCKIINYAICQQNQYQFTDNEYEKQRNIKQNNIA